MATDKTDTPEKDKNVTSPSTPEKDKNVTSPSTPDPTRKELNPGASEVDEEGKDTVLKVPYQRAGQIRQALAELRSAEGQGLLERVRAARKTLRSLGYRLKDEKPKEISEENDQTKEGSKEPVDARRQMPEGRSATAPTTVRTDSPTTPPKPSGTTPPKPSEPPTRGTTSR